MSDHRSEATKLKRPRKPRNENYTVKDAVIELLKIRSLITIAIIGVMSFLAVKEVIAPETFMTVASAVITYYFTRKEDKEK